MSKIYGYMRVSTDKQNTDRQSHAIFKYVNENELDIEDIFEDKVSGKKYKRPQYEMLKSIVEDGDTVIIKEIDRLGRDWEQNKEEWKWFIDKGVNLIVIDTPILSAKVENIDQRFIQEQMFTLLNYLSEKEREKISTRTLEGLAQAKARGVKLGSPREIDYQAVYDYYNESPTRTYVDVAEYFDIAHVTVGKIVRQMRKEEQEKTKEHKHNKFIEKVNV